jgi:hypothetical protein
MKTLIFILLVFINTSCYSQDTVKVVMLFSDTALTDLVGTDENGEDYTELGFDEYCYWRRGYAIINPGKEIIYLDADKKRIPTTNIIWFHKIVR